MERIDTQPQPTRADLEAPRANMEFIENLRANLSHSITEVTVDYMVRLVEEIAGPEAVEKVRRELSVEE
jgi:hypothetical protein